MAFNLHAICIPKETLSTIVGPGRCGDNELVTASLINVQLCVVHIMFLKYQTTCADKAWQPSHAEPSWRESACAFDQI